MTASSDPNWNQQTLTSWQRVYGIQVNNPYGQDSQCHIQVQTVVVDSTNTLQYWTDLPPWDLSFSAAAQDPELAPYVSQIMEGFSGLTQILFNRANSQQ